MKQFIEIPIPVPPMLMEIIGCFEDAQYCSIGYFGTKATWSTGWQSHTFSYYTAYKPLIEHPAILISLCPYHLGSDEKYPTHLLLIDSLKSKMWIGEIAEVKSFLAAHNLPPTVELEPEDYEKLSSEQMQYQGLFEFALGQNDKQLEQTNALIAWLDQFIDQKLVSEYMTAAISGDRRMMMVLRNIVTHISELN